MKAATKSHGPRNVVAEAFVASTGIAAWGSDGDSVGP